MDRQPHPVATALRAERKRRRITQAHIATTIGTVASAISMYENGHRWPVLDTLVRWADALGYDLTLTPKEGSK